MDFDRVRLPRNPRDTANPVSKVFFLWILPLFRAGYSKELSLNDLYAVAEGDSATFLGAQLTKAWETQLETAKRTAKPPKFYKALVAVFWPTIVKIIVIYCVDSWVLQVGGPVCLRLLIKSLNESDESSWETYAYTSGVVAAVVLHAILLHPTVFDIVHLGMKCRVATSALIYKKALKLRRGTEGEASVGRLVNLLSNDVNRFDYSINFIPFLVAGPVQFAIFMYFLWDAIGVSVFAAVGFVLLLLPFQFFSGKYAAKYRLRIAKKTDVRGGLMSEIVGGMRVIKMYAWEKPFSALVDDVRKLEVKELRKRFILRGIHLGLIQTGPKLVAYVTFLVYVLAGNDMTSETVFFTLTSLYVVVQIVLHFMPEAFAGIGETIVALNRIQDCLMLEEHVGRHSEEMTEKKAIPSVVLKGVSASWGGERRTLEGVSGDVRGDKLVMVVGSVGAGKSSLLQLISSELRAESGSLEVEGRLSYASQEPWIFPGTLRQNILFGLKFDAARYAETLRVCALQDDLRQFPLGDLTLVGERGVSLSGGQKARVNLARAVYRKAEIYLLDDPLSAVDPKVSRHLVEEVLKGRLLGGCLKVLVTHQLHFLPHADHVFVLSHGKVLVQGTYAEVMAAGLDLVGMTASPQEEDTKRKASGVDVAVAAEVAVRVAGEESSGGAKGEASAEGEVTGRTYWEYFSTADSSPRFWSLVLVMAASQFLLTGNDVWLSTWAKAEDAGGDAYWGEWRYLVVYSALNLTASLFCFLRALLFYTFCMRICVRLHNRMFSALVRAPTAFFDANPSGRVMNRFTKDMGAIDELLPPAMADAITIFMNMSGALVIVITSNYFLAIPTLVLLVAVLFTRRFFIRTARDLKRIEALTRSPLFTHLAATMQGLPTVRAAHREAVLTAQFNGHLDKHSSVWILFLGANRWFGISLEMMTSFFLAVVAFSFVTLTSSSSTGGNAGLAISSIMSLMGSFQWGMRQSAEAENFMTSVERALEYANLTPEAALESQKEPPEDWPSAGTVSFRNVSLAYEEGSAVLSNLTFDIEGSSKVGIVGRTGAGKSSMIAALFRLTEPSGEIWVDGVKVNEVGLHDLRTNISIIPQDPILFSGSVRYNLDPFGQFADADLWKAIEEVELKGEVDSLEDAVSEGGSNFSVGQRQLICLARAILRKNRILVMDEATANVDPNTDALIQSTIRRVFTDCTTITIAHRLHSVIDCDRILVLHEGRLKECDHPHVLLQNDAGLFSAMVRGTGRASEVFLRTSAQKAFSDKSRRQ